MAKFDSLKNSLLKATESISKAAVETGNKLKDIDIEETVSQTTGTILKAKDSVEERVKNFDADKAKGKVLKMASEGKEALSKHFAESKQTTKKVKEVLDNSKSENKRIHVIDALKLIYLVMAADGEVSKEEKEKYALIVNDFKGYNEETEGIDDYCQAINNMELTENYNNDLIKNVIDVLSHYKLHSDGSVNKQVMLWNLLTIAYSDGIYSKEEKDLIYIITRSMNIDESIIQDMEASMSTLLAIENEREFLMNTDRQYLKIQEKIKVLDERKDVIMESVRELLED